MTEGDDAIRWERIKSLVADALEREPADRAVFLDRAAGADAGLRREVESLLAAHERGSDLMGSPTLTEPLWAEEHDGAAAVAEGAPARRPAGPLPESFGRYRIRSLLGMGGMGEVYLAHDPLLERDVALKVLTPDLAAHPHRRARFLREARAAASLNHPNITTIHEVGEADGRDYIAFEHVQGRTLREVLRERTLALTELVDIAAAVADALAYAHERGIVHRDVKPGNVMVTERGLPKLLDFGLAKLVQADDSSDASRAPAPPLPAAAASGAAAAGTDGRGAASTLTLGGAISGTPGAMSPEQALGRTVDHRTDVFSFGSLLYEMAGGRAAFSGATAERTMRAVIGEEPLPLTELRRDLPPELVGIVEKALRKDPGGRYQRIADLAGDLRRFRRATEVGLPPARPARTFPVGALIVLAVLFAGSASLLIARRAWLQPETAPVVPAAAAEPAAALPAFAAVMYFESPDDPADGDRLGAMLSRLLTTQLSANDSIRMLSPQRLYDVARQMGNEDGHIDRATASEVARTAGVGTMILGQVARVSGTLMATADVVDVASGASLGSHQASGGQVGDVFAMAEALGRQIRDTLRAPAMSGPEKLALEQQLTTSVDAYRDFVRGMEALQRNRVEEAAEAFRKATDIDPAFALAHFRLAMALIWTGRFDESTAATERALAFREKLPADVRLLVETALPYFQHDNTREALPMLLDVLAQDPDNHDAMYLAAEIYTHSATRNDARKADEMYKRLLETVPGFALVYEHVLSALLRQGRFDAARARLEGWARYAPANIEELQGQLALWEGRIADATELLGDQLATGMLGEPRDSRAVATLVGQPVPEIVAGLGDRAGLYRVVELDLSGAVLAAHGRFEDAVELYRLAVNVPPEDPSKDGFLNSAHGGARHHLAFMLAELGRDEEARREVAAALKRQPESFRCLYVSTLFALRAGDVVAAQEHFAVLRDLATRDWSPTASLYRDAVAAELALADGHAEEARTTLQALVDSGRLMEDWYAFEDSVGPLLRDGLARACRALGDAEGEARALDGLIGAGFERLRHPIPWTLALYRRGLLDLQLGRTTHGRELLERFVRLWGSAEGPPPEVVDARARLAETAPTAQEPPR